MTGKITTKHVAAALPYTEIMLNCTQLTELEDLFDNAIDSVFVKIKTKDTPVILGSIYKLP